jgi:glycosyltransferase involved in cell wall biosynthesis
MHVAYIHQHFSTRKGATGTRSYEFSRCLLEAGHRVSMICGVYETAAGAIPLSDGRRVLDIDGIRVHCVPEPYSNKMGFARRLLAFGRFARAAERIVRGLDADLVFATSTPLSVGLPGMKGARHLGVPFVFEVRDLWPELPIAMGIIRNPLLKWYTRRLERRIYFAARHIIALAPGIQEGICRTGYPRERTSMIPNASDLDLFRPNDAPLEDPRFGPPEDFRLVFTGAHGLANGLDAVLDAAGELRRRGVRGVRFVFIGEGGQRERLIQRSRSEGLTECTSWVPLVPKEELARLLPRMDVGLMILKNVPSFYYGTSPNKFFDYIACGLPVLNNYPGWLAEMIREHRCGLAVPPDDPKAFADAVLWLRDHPDERCAMGRRARRLAETQFSRAVLGRRFVELLERVHEEWREQRRRTD